MNHREQSESSDVSWETVFALGSEPRRLALVRVLAAHERTLTIDDLAKEIAVRRTGKEITEISGDRLVRCRIALHHSHVPRLVEAGAVTYDSERGVVDPNERLAAIHSRLESVGTGDGDSDR